MDDIDYGTFLTPRPQRPSGRKLMYDTFAAIAEAKRKRELAEMEDAQRRAASQLNYESSMYGHDITAKHNAATEAGAEAARGETGRHNLATEGDQEADREQRKQEAMSKLMADKDFRAAMASGDPNALAQWMPMMQANGITVEDVMEPGTNFQEGQPGPLESASIAELEDPVDAVSGPAPVAQAPAPTGRKSIRGPGGLDFMFDPATNAINRAATASKLQGGMEEAAGSMGPQSAEGTRDAASLARSYVAAGMDPIEAAKLAGQQATALAGQASGRRNADVAGARGAARTGQGEERIDLAQGTYAWARAKDILGQFEFKAVNAQNRKFNDLVTQLSGKPNPATDAVIAGSFVKMAQGGTGVISDGDMRAFWDNIGGLGIKTWGHVQKVIDGTMDPDKRVAVLAAVRDLARASRGHILQIHEALRSGLENDHRISPEDRAGILKTFGAAPTAPASKAGGGEQAAQGLLGKYK